jgi:hypothetical protein
MAIFLIPETLDVVQFSEDPTEPAILMENFTWLIKELESFDPAHVLVGRRGKNFPMAGRGNRRIQRAKDAPGLGYSYLQFAQSATTKITNKGTISVTSFGYPVHVEKWKVEAATKPVVDTSKGETYDGGPYECLITSRADLQKKKRTRCYVSCSCPDFKYTFKAKLQEKGYTDPDEKIPEAGSGSSGKINPTQPAICKHIFAVLNNIKEYKDYIETEMGPVESAELFGDKLGVVGRVKQIAGKILPSVFAPKPAKPIPAPVVKPIVPTKTQIKNDMKQTIINVLQAEDLAIPSNKPESYLDSRKFSKAANPPMHFYRYKFVVRVEDNEGHGAIYYANPALAGSKAGQKLVIIPKLSKQQSYYLFNTKELHELITKFTTEMPDSVETEIEKLKDSGKHVLFYESILEFSDEMKLLNENSLIKKLLMEL